MIKIKLAVTTDDRSLAHAVIHEENFRTFDAVSAALHDMIGQVPGNVYVAAWNESHELIGDVTIQDGDGLEDLVEVLLPIELMFDDEAARAFAEQLHASVAALIHQHGYKNVARMVANWHA